MKIRACVTGAVTFGLFLCLTLLVFAHGTSQTGPQGAKPNSAIGGVVRDGISGQPVAGAVVNLTPPREVKPAASARQITDDKGRFLFAALPAADGYLVSASRPGYMARTGATIRLADGQTRLGADVVLWPLASIAGTVVAGEAAIAGVAVRALPLVSISGSKHLAAGVVVKTDDLGRYHLGNLPPGEYIVQIPYIPSQSPFPHAPVFFASATRLEQAQAIVLTFGQQQGNVDFQLKPVPTFSLAGRIEAESGALSGSRLRLLVPGTQGLSEGELSSTLVGSAGTFDFKQVPAGDYLIDARPVVGQIEVRSLTSATASVLPPAAQVGSTFSSLRVAAAPPGTVVSMRELKSGKEWWIQEAVTVDRNLSNLLLRTRRTLTVRGRQVWEDGLPFGAGDHPAAVQLRLEPANGDPWLGVPRATARETFTFTGVMAGQYVVRLAGNARIKAIAWNGRDYTQRPLDTTGETDLAELEITLTNATTSVTGRVRGDRLQANADAVVLVFPVEADQRTGYGYSPSRLAATSVNSDGVFQVADLDSGEYFAVAVPAEQSDRWMDPSFLARAATSGTRLTLRWGSTATVDLTLSVLK